MVAATVPLCLALAYLVDLFRALRKRLWSCEAPKADLDGGQGDEGADGGGDGPVVLDETAVAAEPGEGALDDPAPPDHLEADSVRAAPDHGETQRVSASFLHNNRNKRSAVLDLKKEAGRRAIHTLARNADVFVQSFRPGVAERIGVGENAIRAVAPSLA